MGQFYSFSCVSLFGLSLAALTTARAEQNDALASPLELLNDRGFTFEKREKAFFELKFRTSQSEGKTTIANDKISHGSSSQSYGAALASPLGSSVVFVASLQRQSREQNSTNVIGRRLSASATSSVGTFFAGPILHVGSNLFGGTAGVYAFGQQKRSQTVKAKSLSEEVGSALVPSMNVFAGHNGEVFKLVLGAQLPNSHENDATVTDDSGVTYKKSMPRRVASEVWLDSRVQVAENVMLTLGASWIGEAKASERSDEMTPTLARTESGEHTATSVGKKLNKDYAHLRLGGVLNTDASVNLSSTVHYYQPHFAQAQFASAQAQNLGGFEIDVGPQILLASGNLGLEVGYLVPQKKSFGVSTDESVPFATAGESGSSESAQWKVRAVLAVGL